ncbi:MAG: hypothetical protein HGA38_00940 [Candidatus Moranbacteria bacterium]|nr:hypothetical protein [Candidatus Moranbacteria bacterium]
MENKKPYFRNPIFMEELPSELRGFSSAVAFLYDKATGRIRTLHFGLYFQQRLREFLDAGTITAEDLERLIHLKLLNEAGDQYRWGYGTPFARICTAYFVTWGVLPLKEVREVCTDEDIDAALRLVPDAVKELMATVPDSGLGSWGCPSGPFCDCCYDH